jgi:hypothetical protein
MQRRFFAVFTDHDQRPFAHICDGRFSAEVHAGRFGDKSEIVHFMADDGLMEQEMSGPFFLAFTVEDEGLRICGIFQSEMALSHYRAEHYMESPCRSAEARPVALLGKARRA